MEEATQLYRMGKFDEAIAQYDAIIGNRPNQAVAYAGLARCYLKLKKPDDAYLAATKAVAQDPSLGAAHSALGEVSFRQGKLQEAEADFLAALKVDPADARSYLGLARLDQATYNFKKAKVSLDKAYGLDPADPDISGAWVQTRSRSEQIKALEDDIASPSNYYSRVEKAGFKQRLSILTDEVAHPERTCTVASQPESAEMRLTRIGKRDFAGLDVQVNGEAARLVLGTVSSGIVINGRIAEKAGVKPIAQADIDGLGEQNPPEVYIGLAKSLQVGPLDFHNCYVTVVERASPRSFYDQFEGSIAAGLFYSYLVDVDVPHAKLKLRPLPSGPATEDHESAAMDSSDPGARNFYDRYTPSQMSTWTRMDRFGSAIVVPARVNDSPPELFEIEAASKFNVLAPELARERASLKPDKASAHLEGSDGKVSGETTGQVNLEFADLHFNAINVISFDNARVSESAETEISGYLGFDLLRNLHFIIDYRDGLVHFENSPSPE